MKEHTLPMLADRLNHEPIVALGCNTSEVMTTTGVFVALGAVLAIPLGFVLGAAFGASVGLFLGFACFFLCAMGGTYLALNKLQRHKESHGEHHYKKLLHCRLSEFGLGGTAVFQQSLRFVRGKSL